MEQQNEPVKPQINNQNSQFQGGNIVAESIPVSNDIQRFQQPQQPQQFQQQQQQQQPQMFQQQQQPQQIAQVMPQGLIQEQPNNCKYSKDVVFLVPQCFDYANKSKCFFYIYFTFTLFLVLTMIIQFIFGDVLIAVSTLFLNISIGLQSYCYYQGVSIFEKFQSLTFDKIMKFLKIAVFPLILGLIGTIIDILNSEGGTVRQILVNICFYLVLLYLLYAYHQKTKIIQSQIYKLNVNNQQVVINDFQSPEQQSLKKAMDEIPVLTQ